MGGISRRVIRRRRNGYNHGFYLCYPFVRPGSLERSVVKIVDETVEEHAMPSEILEQIQ